MGRSSVSIYPSRLSRRDEAPPASREHVSWPMAARAQNTPDITMTKTLAETIVSELMDLIETDRGLVKDRAVERVEMVLSSHGEDTITQTISAENWADAWFKSGVNQYRSQHANKDLSQRLADNVDKANEKLWQELSEEPAGSTSNSALTTDHILAAHRAMERNEAEMQRLRDEAVGLNDPCSMRINGECFIYIDGVYYKRDKDGNFVVDKQ